MVWRGIHSSGVERLFSIYKALSFIPRMSEVAGRERELEKLSLRQPSGH